MTNRFYNSAKMLAVLFFTGLTAISCSTDDDVPGVDPPQSEDERKFTVALSVGSGRNPAKVYVQSDTDLSTGDISYGGYGFEMPSTRTARIFSSADGQYVYNLDYGGGKIYKYRAEGGEDFTQLAEKNVEFAMGSAHPRWTKASEETALLHNVLTERQYDENSDYLGTTSTIRLMSVGLENLSIGEIIEFELPRSGVDEDTKDFVFRIDAPVIAGNKVYYGMGKRGYDASTDENTSATYPNVETLVVDYPSLTNPRIISTDVDGARGATNGYRTPVSQVDENGDVYQLVSVPDNTFETFILRIRDGEYDESYSFNLSELLGENTTSNGWFYVGNGIGYIPYANTDEGGTGDPVWSVARIDLYNNTAVKLNLPDNLWLQQYQNGVLEDGKFYMAISPLGQEGNIYIFDTESTSPDGYTVGASLESGADATYIGVY